MTGRVLPPVLGPVSASALWDAAVALLKGTVDAAALDDALARAFPGRSVLLTDSGTNALAQTFRRNAGGTGRTPVPIVALPAWCCPDIGTAAIAAAHRVVLYDLDPQTLLPDLESVERCLRAGAGALVLTHFFGRITDPALVASMAAQYGAVVIEDAAQGAGGALAGQPAGTLTNWGVLSFGRGKGRNAGGGGALLSTDPLTETGQIAEGRVHNAKALAATVATVLLGRPHIYGLLASLPFLRLGDTAYKAPSADHGPSMVTCALLPSVLAASEEAAARRRQIASRWREALLDLNGGLVRTVGADSVDGALRFPVLISSAAAADLRPHGVVRSYPRTLSNYPEIAMAMVHSKDTFPGAELLAARLHTLPTHRFVRPDDLERVRRRLQRP